LETFEQSSGFRVAFDHEELFELLAAIEERWHHIEVRRSLAAALGDWEMLLSLIEGEDLPKNEGLHQASISERASFLEADFAAGIDQAESLHALKDLGSPLLSDALRQALSGPPSFTTSTAIDVASDFEKEDYCDEIKTALSHIDSNG
ncbi:unnamed protein product, partial [Ectocarpus fasciculatus]